VVALGSTAIAMALSTPRSARVPLVAAIAAIAVCWVGGLVALHGDVAAHPYSRSVAVVQTNVEPTLHWTRAYTDKQVATHVRATNALPDDDDLDLIVWPENSVPRYLEQEPMLAAMLAGVAVRHHADLLIGGPRFEDGHTYNAARLLTSAGRNGGHYDKRRLVLFAEEKPMRFAAAADPNESPEEFTPGTGASVLRSFVPIGVSICHEIVHPDLTRASVRDGAEMLVNIANDGWLDGGYGFAGPQHLAMAVFRAVETRRWLVRAATTGTSAVIDPYGTIVAAQAPGTAGVVRAGVAGRRTVTPYVRFGDAFALACTGLVASWFLTRALARLRRRAPVGLAPATS
jgi:apolipoprotein N-acyltransferase